MSADREDPVCPEITSIKEAIAIGMALAKVLRFDPGWAEKVYNGTPQITYRVGADALNHELDSMWRYTTTLDERRCIIAEYVAARLA